MPPRKKKYFQNASQMYLNGNSALWCVPEYHLHMLVDLLLYLAFGNGSNLSSDAVESSI